MQDVIERIGTPLPSEAPILFYPAREGGFYVFFFVPTNELTPTVPNREFLTLLAVTKYNNTLLDTNSEGIYLLPKSLRGKRCTGPRQGEQQGPASVNAIVTGFSEYDRAFIVAVQSKWYALLDEHRGGMRVGKVVLEFRLHSDGRISNMKMTDNGVGKILGLYCQSAILEPAPYLPWPDEMRRAIGANHRDVKFTFFYN
jgi:hypothetical protein